RGAAFGETHPVKRGIIGNLAAHTEIRGDAGMPWLIITCCAAGLVFASSQFTRADQAKNAKTFEVDAVHDVAYYEGKDAHKVKHKLDLYLPKGQKDFPVLFFVHGGAWSTGDKKFFGVYSSLGRQFAKHGIGTVVTNYRLSPGVQHPEHIKDI